MNYITVKLTEDQISACIAGLDANHYDGQWNPDTDRFELDAYEQKHNAYLQRLADKLRQARAKS